MSSVRAELQRYKSSVAQEQRLASSTRILATSVDSVPIILLPGAGLTNVKTYKFVMARSTQASSLIYTMRKELVLSQREGIFIYLPDGRLVQSDMVLGDLYETCKDSDNFLYLVVAKQEEMGH